MKYQPQLDGLRAVAILAVFVQHAFPVPLLWAGVDLFFILSGYLITSILVRDREKHTFGTLAKNFYLRRAQRILPAYLLFLGFVAIFAAENLHGMGLYLVTFFQNVPFAFHWMRIGALDPLWSLAVEQHFYLLWPVVIFFIPRRWVIRILLATLVLVPVLRALCTPLFSSPDAIYSLTPFRIDAMAVGALAAFLLPHVNRQTAIRWAKAAMVSGMALYVVGNHFSAFHRQANTAIFNGLGYSLNLLVLGGLFVWVTLDEGS
ncbi:MAG: acyltransferase, partial [Bryocella sp.]